MATPYFVADSASVTIMRSLASSSYGSYSLNLPDGIELEDVHDFDAPGNTLGYVAHVGHGRRVGGLARRFVRADVNVTAADPSDPDRFPDSDVDRVLRDVAERVSGDFFLETDVSKAGLGPWVPHVDFKVGDLARVEIWGQVVVLPVTRIEEVVSDHDIVDWRVHVGGQLVSDEEARKAENLALHRAFLQDRRELAGVEGIASQAARTAGEAQASADGLAEDLTGDTDTKPSDAVERRTGTLGLLADEVEAAQWAAIEANDSAIRENDARLDEQEALLMQLQAQQRELASRSHVVMAVAYLDDPYEDDYITLTVTREDVQLRHRLEAKGNWLGYAYFLNRESSWGGITGALGYRSWAANMPNSYHMERVAGIYSVLPGKQHLNNKNTGAFTPSGWHTIDTYTATTNNPARDMMINLRVGWDSATFGDEYGLRVTVNGTPRYTLGPVTGLGPLTPVGGFLFDTGHKIQTLNTTLESVPKGAVVRMQVYSSANSASSRRVRSSRLTMSWVEEAVAE